MKQKTKVLFIHHGAVFGGAPTSLRNLVQGIAQNRRLSCTICCIWPQMVEFFSSLEHVKVCLYPRTGLFAGRVFMGWSPGISIRKLIYLIIEFIKSPIFIYREIRFLKNKQPDIVHLNSSILWCSAIAAKMCNIQIVWHIREASGDMRLDVFRRVYTWFIRKLSSKVICIGPQEFKVLGGYRSPKVIKIYNSLSDSYFSDNHYDKRKIREELGIPIESYIFLSLGGLSFKKGTYQFISALQYLPSSYSAVLVGSKPSGLSYQDSWLFNNMHKLEEKLVASGIKRYLTWDYDRRVARQIKRVDSNRLVLAGIVKDVKPFIKACDVLIFAGTTPHSARPVYEAWGLKKPVIVFDTEVMRHDINDGIDGVLVMEHTAEALASSIKEVSENSTLAQAMGTAGYSKACERFSMKKNNEKIMKIYMELLGENSI